jgi:hypothetical protein
MKARRSSSDRPFSGLSLLSSIPGTTSSSGSPPFAAEVRPTPTFDVSPSIRASSSLENVICRELARSNFDGSPANSCSSVPSGATT